MKFNEIAIEYGQVSEFTKNEHIFNFGDKSNSIYIILEGVVKAFYITEEGKEYIKTFLFSGDTIASLQALNGGKCSFSLQCLQNTKVIKIAYHKIIAVSELNIEMANAVIKLLMSFAMKKEKREYELLCLDAQKRFEQLLERSPDIYEHITQNDIARYLGITPVALSRIKNYIKN